MRAAFAVVLLSLAGVPSVSAAGLPRYTRCCVDLGIPDVPPGPVCAQVRGRGRVGPRRACRLLGGRPIGPGDCSIAACREPA